MWRVDGTKAVPAVPTPYDHVAAPALRPDLAELLAIDDVVVTVEHGIIRGECRGLEVARISGEGHEQRLDVGVGAYDQGAFAVMNPDLTPTESLGVVVERVLEHRRRGAPPHPINRLVRERWLRHELLVDPQRIGLVSAEPVMPSSPRGGLNEVIAACALGIDSFGARVLVACSSGIDLDAVPEAADLAELHQADRIAMVVADRDRHRLVLTMAARCRRPIEFVTADEPWADEPWADKARADKARADEPWADKARADKARADKARADEASANG